MSRSCAAESAFANGKALSRLELIEKRRGRANKYGWEPFEPSDNFNPDWWEHQSYYKDDPWYVQVLRGGVEVGRVELDESIDFRHYVADPHLQSIALEIQFIEVSTEYLRQGIGTEIVRELAATHSSRRLVALSEQADEFWASLGWRRYGHPKERKRPQGYRPLFIQQ